MFKYFSENWYFLIYLLLKICEEHFEMEQVGTSTIKIHRSLEISSAVSIVYTRKICTF